MPENPGIPLLFRDIFKKAYLPYRDPETLKMFLKIIDEFTYDHSERLGDAFETNYTLRKYQFAFLAYHMLAMSFVYSNIWQIKQARPADNKRSPQSIVSPRDRGAKNAFFPGQKIRIGSGGAAADLATAFGGGRRAWQPAFRPVFPGRYELTGDIILF